LPLTPLRRIDAGAVVDVNKVQADRGVADARLTGTALAELDLLPDQNLGTPVL
jgi:hypothetical protein